MEHAYRRGRQNMRKNNGMQEAAAAMRGMSVPNSAITSLFGDMGMGGSADIDAAMQTRITMLNRQRPAAEREADRLSAGVRARTPEQLKSEMGARLGADFSSVRFHSDSSSVRRGDDIGARAWTQGNDVYFGEGGFDPAVAAHELVHTVQQGSVSGQVGVSAPAGEIQMMPNPLKWIKNKFGERKRRKEQEKAELKLSRNAKKPWEMSKKDFKDNHFNPGDVDEISDIQKEIDGAQTANEAYKAFLKYTGDDSGGMKKKVTDENGNVIQYEAWTPEGLDLKRFKGKLKNMTRMVHDYPELRGMVGDMVENTKGDAAMAASSTKGGTVKTELDYDISGDQKGFAGTMDRAMTNVYEFFTGFSAADTSYDGNHELGHVLNSLLFASGDADRDWKYSITADEMLREVLKEDGVLSVKQRGKIVPRKKDSLRNNSPDGYYYKDQIDLGATGAQKLGLTSGYGETDASEFFAEAFADVYAHGNKARKASIELVKKYEERMKKKRGGAARR